MKKRTVIALSFVITALFNADPVLSQQRIIIYSKEENNPVSFANVNYWLGDTIIGGNYSSEKGLIEIPNKKIDALEISCIGYKKKKIIVSKVTDTIHLIKDLIPLDEIQIAKPNSSKTILLGFSNSDKKLSISSEKGIEVVIFIESKFKVPKPIKSFLFNAKRSKKFRTSVRIHYYKLNTDFFEPGDEFLKQDITYHVEGKSKGLVKVDLSDFNLTLPPEGAFIGIEWLGVTENGNFVDMEDNWNDTSIEYNYKVNKPLTFIRTRFSNYGWQNTQQLKESLHVNSENYPNASFGIEIFDN